MAAAATAESVQVEEEYEECVTYQHVKILESAGIGIIYILCTHTYAPF